MTLRRATLYVAGGTLLVAWFSSAASMSLARNPRRAPQVVRPTAAPAQNLAVSVQTQAKRLKERLAVAPLPQQPSGILSRSGPHPNSALRRFRGQPVPRSDDRTDEDGHPGRPRCLLVGLAEHRNGDGLVRSAAISSNGEDLIMADVGSVIVGRYTVTSIGSDAVEMKDGSTGRIRRLVLQN
jgi:hypothetical protein